MVVFLYEKNIYLIIDCLVALHPAGLYCEVKSLEPLQPPFVLSLRVALGCAERQGCGGGGRRGCREEDGK